MTRRTAMGRLGEAAAAEDARRRGYEVVAQNVRAGGGEIDLVVLDGDTVAIVEVKLRSTRGHGDGAEAVTAAKRQRVIRTATAWLMARGWLNRYIRFDVAAVTTPQVEGEGECEVEWIADAFRPQ